MINFNKDSYFVSDWYKETKPVGLSNVLIYPYQIPNRQIAIFYSELVREDKNESYCSTYTKTDLNLVGYNYISFLCKAKGNATTYKIFLKDDNIKHPELSFKQSFKVGTLFFKS